LYSQNKKKRHNKSQHFSVDHIE